MVFLWFSYGFPMVWPKTPRLLLQLPVELQRIVQRLRGAAGVAARQLDLGGVKT